MAFVLQAISLVGAVLILGAFFAPQRRWCRSDDQSYLWANLVGAALLTLVAIADRRAGFVMLEGTWVLIAAAGLVGSGARVGPSSP